ncbi:TPA: hypothetical protein ACX6QL_001435 [Photobacterium damselae]
MNAIEMIISLHSAKSQRLCDRPKINNRAITRDVLVGSISAALLSNEHKIGYDVIKMKYLEDSQSTLRVSIYAKEELSLLSSNLRDLIVDEIIALVCERITPSHTNHAMSQYRLYGPISSGVKYQQKLITKRLKLATTNGDEDEVARCNTQLMTMRVHANTNIKRRIHNSDKCPRCRGTGRIGANLYQCPSCDGQGILKYRTEILSRYIRALSINITPSEADKLRELIDRITRELNHKMWMAADAISKQKHKEFESD